MIADHDRSGWFGASDTAMILGNWNTKSFEAWWKKKLGIDHSHFTNTAMLAGTHYEHPILKAIGADEMDKQLFVPALRLRVNLDGNTGHKIHEVKTYKLASCKAPWKPTKAYVQQVQVQMFAARENGWKDVSAEIVGYGLEEEDYVNFFREIDKRRLSRFEQMEDPIFISGYLKKLEYLAKCLEKGVFP